MQAAIAQSSVRPAEVDRIVAIRNRVIRNLEITECYADLSQAMRDRTGDAANWCTFATWASRQAGSTIRGEDLFAHFHRKLGEPARWLAPLQACYRMLLRKGLFEPDTRLGRAVAAIHKPFDAFERASAAVATGNLKVFAEIGREFARFLTTVPADAHPDSPALLAFVNALRAGPPPDGQDYLKQAFTHYQQQRQETDKAAQAAWILLANLKIGLHEQIRLQPQIVAAVEAPLVTAAELGVRLLRAFFPRAHQWRGCTHRPLVLLVGWLAKRVHDAAAALTREAVTKAMMVLALPHVVLSLGDNLEAPVPPVFIDNPHTPLAEFVRQYDPCTPGSSNCAAGDWCDLQQRMHYILHLFRASAQERVLFARPFTAEQVAKFRAGIVPEGEL
ncbi:MAG: hypothetical protein ONB48_14435 [candidate division KSB1 bacterium]|nr:hypothetical protein [candidate division KSB1 bacterium]MDZ7273565.1 hypothetical protein [candidate division KSB1 bacterium]MDZ7286844.1 hypothetical protein [candidate division KSB1 bacterium]MDZ7299799.1 hypothetical protein [candidate division KSB1 bacterium]MDZ7308650.1 hypothetical protein [candidate division KSB1 bacterium]